MDEIKNMLDYKVGHYVHYNDITSANKQNVLPNGQFDKFKAQLIADGSQQGRHLYDFVSSATVSLQVVLLLFNIASYYKCILQTVDIRGAFLNAQFSSEDKSIYFRINKDTPSHTGFFRIHQLILTLQNKNNCYYYQTGFYMALNNHLSRTLVDAGYKQSINDEC